MRHDFIELLEWDFRAVEGVFRVLNAKLRSNLTDFSASKSKEVAQQESMQITKTIQQSLVAKRRNRNTKYNYRQLFWIHWQLWRNLL